MKKGKPSTSLYLILGGIFVAILILWSYIKTPGSEYSREQKILPGLPEEQQQIVEATKVQAVTTILARARNWDLDPETDGIEFTLSPKDAEGNLMVTDGIASARLWYAVYDENYNRVKGNLIQEWNNVPISKENYDFYGTKIILEFVNFIPQPNDYGFFDVTLITPDGKSFTSKETLLVLRFS